MKALALAAALAIAAGAQSTGKLEGVVVNSATGKPVAGATVVLEGPEDSYVVECDDVGHFVAGGVAAGEYEGRAQRDGYSPQKRKVRFAVTAGAHVDGMALRLIPLGAISGRVVDADGDAVSKVMVEAMRYAYPEGKKKLTTVGRVMSDDRGEYRLAGLAPGAYYLRGSIPAPFGRSMAASMRLLGPKPVYDLATAYFPSAADPGSAVVLDLAAGAELRNNAITLRPAQTYILRLTVAGSPPPGANPMVTVAMPMGGRMGFDAPYGVTRQIPNSPPGAYLVSGEDKARGLSARQSVQVVNGDVDVTLTLRPEVEVNGTLRAAGKRIALEGARVTLEAGDLNRAEAVVRGDGTFAIGHVQPVVQTVRVTAPAGTYVKEIRVGERVLSSPQFDAGRSSGALEITLGTDGGTLTGSELPEGAVVAAVPGGQLRDWADLVRTANAGADGRFELRDLAPGEYRVFAWEDVEPGAVLDAEFRRRFQTGAIAVRIGAGARVTVRVRAM